MLKIVKFTFGPLSENTYLLHNGQKAVVIDPGMYESVEEQKFCKFLEDNNLELDKIVCTHCHLDHVAGAYFLQNKFRVPLYIPKGETEVLKMSEISAQFYGMNLFKKVEEFQLIENEGVIDLVGEEFEILFLPGHSPGHLGFLSIKEEVLISGDVLFQGSIGRYDLPGGDFNTLKNSILNVLFHLPDTIQVLSGHGGVTSIGHEKKYNIIHSI